MTMSGGVRVAFATLAFFTVCAMAARALAPHDPNAQPDIVGQRNLPPSVTNPLGTDQFSRDVLSRVIYGTRVSLGVAAASAALAVTIGAAWGAIAGFAGGVADAALMRIVDAVLSVPRVLLLIVLVATLGPPSVGAIILLLGLTGWPATSRIVRSAVLGLRRREFVLAARAMGLPEWRILTTHLFPAIVPQVTVAATLAFAAVIPLEAGLSFLGLGVRPPTPSWGNIILDGRDRPAETWWLVLFPGIAIVATVLAVNAIADWLREMNDPRQQAPR
jgi:peptide/nickel transport system permease protein